MHVTGEHKSDFDVDHIIPSLWHNNDLEPGPGTPSVNNRKEQASLAPSSDRKMLDHYWKHSRERYRLRFDRNLQHYDLKTPDRWHTLLFNIIAEAIEITAIQRGWKDGKLLSLAQDTIINKEIVKL